VDEPGDGRAGEKDSDKAPSDREQEAFEEAFAKKTHAFGAERGTESQLFTALRRRKKSGIRCRKCKTRTGLICHPERPRAVEREFDRYIDGAWKLFFKALKQNLKVKSFVGTSRNALLIQLIFKLDRLGLEPKLRTGWAS
jgi:hypothetical protein